MKKNPLGRGLGALLPTVEETEIGSIHEIEIEKIIENRHQPRVKFDDEGIMQLAESIRTNGLIQPIVVRKSGEQYELIVGERRLRAAKIVKLLKIPAIIKELSDTHLLITALIENIQRDDLDPLEIARAVKKLVLEFDLTHQQVAEQIGKDRTTVTNYIRILNLPDEIKEHLDSEEISLGHARALLSLENATVQISACREIIKNKLSVRQTEDLVKSLLDNVFKQVQSKKSIKDPFFKESEDLLRKTLSTKVRISPLKNKKGKIEIEYYSQEHLEELLDHLITRNPQS
jgi:ParB family transcriptional regulator, chromosome partitioning protein